jgi:hypothetical protein
MQMTYNQWVKEVDRLIIQQVGLSMHDLPDWLSRDAYEDNISPEEAAQMCLEEADF